MGQVGNLGCRPCSRRPVAERAVRRAVGGWLGAGHPRTKEEFLVQAVWNDEVIAEGDDTVVLEGNHYFPRASVREDVLRESDKQTRCPWKGLASYFTLEVAGKTNSDAAWYYAQPSDAAKQITDHVAFWNGPEVQ